MKLLEHFKRHNVPIDFIGAPKTIDKDLHNDEVEVSFGFNSAAKNYWQIVASFPFDAIYACIAYHFIRAMVPCAYHISL